MKLGGQPFRCFQQAKSTRSSKTALTLPENPWITLVGNAQARRRQLRASSGGSSDATSKASFPLHNTETRQHQGNLDVTSDVVLSCCCCPSAGADLNSEPKRVVSKRVVLADVPPERKPERGYVRMLPRSEKLGDAP